MKLKLSGMNPRKKMVFRITVVGVTLIVLGVMAAFVEQNHEAKSCKEIIVKLHSIGEDNLITQNEILKLISANGADPIEGKSLAEVQLNWIETQLKNNPYISDAQAYIDLDGKLVVDVKQSSPVIRVINPKNETYYLDSSTRRIPVSASGVVLVPVATASGIYSQLNYSSMRQLDSCLAKVGTQIQANTYMQALCGQVLIADSCKFSIMPRLGNMEIFLGDTSELPHKFARIKAFYQSTLPQMGWTKYKKINLEYTNQIIAIKQ